MKRDAPLRPETLTLRPARSADAARILQIIRQAQARMKARGSDQWQDGYPAPAHIDADIAAQCGYVLCDGAATVAYGVAACTGEAAYEAIDGAWLSDLPYVVVHRLAVADEALRQGVAAEFLRRTERFARARGIRSLRIDTHIDNTPMLHLLGRAGFVRCGEVSCRGGRRIAFEKVLA